MGFDLRMYADENCRKPLEELDWGEWDITKSREFTYYVRNPNSFVHAYLINPSATDSRIEIVMPKTLKPKEVAPVTIRLKAPIFPERELTRDEEAALFADIEAMITATVQWRKENPRASSEKDAAAMQGRGER